MKRLDIAPSKSIATKDGNVRALYDTASSSHSHHSTETNQLDLIEENTNKRESSNPNNQGMQEDETMATIGEHHPAASIKPFPKKFRP